MSNAISESDRLFLRQAVRLGMNGRGSVEPNPMVGCVIVKGGQVIGQGWHEKFGGPHAERQGLENCTESPAGATAYVTLEPCCHTNKKTPPCTDAIVAARIARVVVGCKDPNPQVDGGGMLALRQAGLIVDDADDAECRQLLAPFIARMMLSRPYVTLKWAESADGKVAGPGGRRARISNERSHRVVRDLRSRCDALLVGIGTILNDDPLLTVRGIEPLRPLLRIVLDSDLRLSSHSQLVRSIDRGRIIVYCSKEAADYSGMRIPLAACGVEIHPVSSVSPGQLSLRQAIQHIGSLGVTHLLVEPGPRLAQSFIREGLWDRIWVFRSPTPIADATAPAAVNLSLAPIAQRELDGDVLSEYLNKNDLFAGSFASADIELLGSLHASETRAEERDKL